MSNEGWQYLFNARKCHYFKLDGRSLCGRWLLLVGGANRSPELGFRTKDDCAGCVRKLPKIDDGRMQA